MENQHSRGQFNDERWIFCALVNKVLSEGLWREGNSTYRPEGTEAHMIKVIKDA